MTFRGHFVVLGPRGNEFTGEVNWVQIDPDAAAEDLDHLITPEERLHIARQ
jgi:arylsulfatase